MRAHQCALAQKLAAPQSLEYTLPQHQGEGSVRDGRHRGVRRQEWVQCDLPGQDGQLLLGPGPGPDTAVRGQVPERQRRQDHGGQLHPHQALYHLRNPGPRSPGLLPAAVHYHRRVQPGILQQIPGRPELGGRSQLNPKVRIQGLAGHRHLGGGRDQDIPLHRSTHRYRGNIIHGCCVFPGEARSDQPGPIYGQLVPESG